MSLRTRRDVILAGAQGALSGVALTAGVPGLVGAAAAAVPSLAGIVSLGQTGAAGDGRTDDTVAITEALNQAAVSPFGAIVYAPPGVYRTMGGHVLRPRVQLVGAGVGSTIFRHVGNESCFTLTGPGVSEQRVGIADCSILGNPGPAAVGVEFRDISFGAWARLVRVRDYTAGAGYLLHNHAAGQFTEGVTLLGCSSSNNATGVAFRRSAGTNSFKGFYAEQFGCNVPANGVGFDFGVGGSQPILVYNCAFHGHLWFDRQQHNVGWNLGANATLRDGEVWLSGEGPSATSVSIRNRDGGRVTLFGQWWFGDISHDLRRGRTRIGPLTAGSLHG